MVHAADPDLTTFEWDMGRRAGKVFLDANMNRSMASAAAPYSLRSKWNAPVSMPVAWEEVPRVDPTRFTIETAVGRLAERGDIFAGALSQAQALGPVMRELGL